MTPAQAIKREFRSCKGGQLFRCESKVCALYRPDRPLPKIKVHCRECAGDDYPKECTGRLLDGSICNRHPFRLGKNPNRRRPTSVELEKLARAGAKFRFLPGEKGVSKPPGSTITLPGIPEGNR
jgi:hypothetical protein